MCGFMVKGPDRGGIMQRLVTPTSWPVRGYVIAHVNGCVESSLDWGNMVVLSAFLSSSAQHTRYSAQWDLMLVCYSISC